MIDPVQFGAKKDGATNDLAALDACVLAAIASGPGSTIDLGQGYYNIGNDTWKIGKDAAQHHINVVGAGPLGTQIICDTSAGGTALYCNLQKYAQLEGFSIRNAGARGGYGIQFGGDLGQGMQSNGINVRMVSVTNFDYGMFMSGGIGTSSDILFDHCAFNNCKNGWYTANFNALDYLLLMPEFWGNDVGAYVSTGNVTFIHGCGEYNKTDFYIAGGYDAQVKIEGYRCENAGTQPWLVTASKSYFLVENCIVHSINRGNEVVRMNPAGNGTIRNCMFYDGYITWNPFPQTSLSLDHVSVYMPGSDWSPTTQSKASPAFGPGIRLSNGQGAPGIAPDVNAAHLYLRCVEELSTKTMYPDFNGVGIARPADNLVAIAAVT